MKKRIILIALIFVCVFASTFAVSFPYGGIAVVHSNCTETDYSSASDSDSARGAAFLTASTNAVSGDVLYLSLGTFDLSGNGFNTGVSGGHYNVHGSGINSTKIISADYSTMVTLDSNTILTDLTIQGTWADNVLTVYTNNAKDVWLKNVRVIGDTDSTYFDNDSNIIIINSEIDGALTSLQGFHNCVINVYDSKINATQNYSLVGSSENDAIISFSGSMINLWNSDINAGGADTRSYGARVTNDTDTIINLYNSRVSTYGDGSLLDLANQGYSGSVLGVDGDTVYDAGKTSGVITSISTVPDVVPSLPTEACSAPHIVAPDATPPTILSNTLNPINWHTSDFNVWFYDVNFDISGKQFAKYSIDGGAFQNFDYNIGDTNFGIPITTDGNHTIQAWFRDTAGNDLNISGNALLDKTPPTTTSSGNTYTVYTSFDQNITLSCTDPNSGCHDINYQIDSGNWIDANVSTVNFMVSGDGNHSINFYSTDNAKNLETLKTSYAAISTPKAIQGGGSLPSSFNGSTAISGSVKGNNSIDVSVIRDANRTQYYGGAYTFIIDLDNNSGNNNFTIRETIPKEIASDVNQITFSINPTRIISSDPVVEWDYNSLPAGTKTIAYKVNRLADLSIDGSDFNAFFRAMQKPQIITLSATKTTTKPSIVPTNNTLTQDLCKSTNCDDNKACTIDSCNKGTCTHTDSNSNECIKENNYTETPVGEPNEYVYFGGVALIIIIVLVLAAVVVDFRKQGKHKSS